MKKEVRAHEARVQLHQGGTTPLYCCGQLPCSPMFDKIHDWGSLWHNVVMTYISRYKQQIRVAGQMLQLDDKKTCRAVAWHTRAVEGQHYEVQRPQQTETASQEPYSRFPGEVSDFVSLIGQQYEVQRPQQTEATSKEPYSGFPGAVSDFVSLVGQQYEVQRP